MIIRTVATAWARRTGSLTPSIGPRAGAHLDAYPVIHTQPEEQQGTQEHGLKEIVQHAWEPAVHQKGQREEGIWKAADGRS